MKTGDVVDRRYKLLERLGKGGFGTVYLAEHVEIGHRVAVKLLDRAESEGRFRREGKIVARLDSEHTVQLHDYGRCWDGTPFMVFEYVEGEDLEQIVGREGPLGPPVVLAIFRQILTSLAEAHAAGVVHRDMKPANVMLTYDAVAKVLDFGVARVVSGPTLTDDLTDTGSVVGTLRYIAPEVFDGEEVTPSADIFAVGLTAYWLLTGRRANDEDGVAATLRRTLDQAPFRLPGDLDVPDHLRFWVEGMMAKDPGVRPRDAAAAIADLDRRIGEATDDDGEPLERLARRVTARREAIGDAPPSDDSTRSSPEGEAPTAADSETSLVPEQPLADDPPLEPGRRAQTIGGALAGIAMLVGTFFAIPSAEGDRAWVTLLVLSSAEVGFVALFAATLPTRVRWRSTVYSTLTFAACLLFIATWSYEYGRLQILFILQSLACVTLALTPLVARARTSDPVGDTRPPRPGLFAILALVVTGTMVALVGAALLLGVAAGTVQ